MNNEFQVRTVLCDTSEIRKRELEMESKWLEALLKRARVPKLMIKKKLDNDIGNLKWRHYLFDKFSLEVINDKKTNQVKIIKYLDDDLDGRKEIIGEWSKPEVVRINKHGQRPYCELKLKYWQLL